MTRRIAALLVLGLAAGCAQDYAADYGRAVPAGTAEATTGTAGTVGATAAGGATAGRGGGPVDTTGGTAPGRDQAWDRFEPSSLPGPIEGLGPDRTGGT
ncbi:hypothetical protein [Azospirillum sp. A39]|uniref:hypothetical protein n=1 Tax=Azospirillum sp. A39 TaxID=3462279 RepID=UPI0040457157